MSSPSTTPISLTEPLTGTVNQKLYHSVGVEDWEDTNDTHNEIYNSSCHENPLRKDKKIEESSIWIESSVDEEIDIDDNLIDRPQGEILESSLYTITEEESIVDTISDEEEESAVPEEDSSPKNSENLFSLKSNYLGTSTSDINTLEIVKRRFSE